MKPTPMAVEDIESIRAWYAEQRSMSPAQYRPPKPSGNRPLSRPDVMRALIESAVPYRKIGVWIRLAATWRGGAGFNVAVNAVSGAWTDHKTKEKGDWADLCARLKIEPGHLSAVTSEQNAVDRDRAAKDVAGRIAQAKRLADTSTGEVRKITLAPVEDDIEAMQRLFNLQKRSHRRELAAWNESTLAQRLTDDELRDCYAYLDGRGARGFAAAAGALIGKKTVQMEDETYQTGGWEVRWPMRRDGTSEITCVQRERGRGHDNKAMRGVKSGAGLIVPPQSGDRTCDILAIGEGAMTMKSVWNAFDVWAWIRFDAGNMLTIPPELIKKVLATQIWLIADNDKKEKGETGQKACQALADQIARIRPDITVKIATPPEAGPNGMDWDDVENMVGHSEMRVQFLQSLRYPEPLNVDPAVRIPSNEYHLLKRAGSVPLNQNLAY